MTKYILGLILILFANKVLSHNPTFFERKGDTIIFFLSCNGNLTTRNMASYKRVAFFEKEKLAFRGSVVDYYYPKETIALKANYKNGHYNGRLTTYYKTGAIKETGNYKNNERDSVWTFYYKNHRVEKRIDYSHGQQKLNEYFKKNGSPVFLDGNGTYRGYSNENYSSCEQHPIKGELKNGLMVGRWTINFGYSVSTEVFDNGKFIRGHESPYNRTYESASLINPSGFPYYENITLLNYLIAGNKVGFYWPSYNKKSNLEKGFLADLQHKIQNSLNTDKFFYALLEFQIDNGNVNPNSFKSITNDNQTFAKLKKLILSLNKWDKTKHNVSFTIYLPVFWENGLLYLKPNDMSKFN